MSSHPSYIVVFNDGISDEVKQQYRDSIEKEGGKVKHDYGDTLNGFSAHIPDDHFQSLKGGEHSDKIAYIEPDQQVKTA